MIQLSPFTFLPHVASYLHELLALHRFGYQGLYVAGVLSRQNPPNSKGPWLSFCRIFTPSFFHIHLLPFPHFTTFALNLSSISFRLLRMNGCISRTLLLLARTLLYNSNHPSSPSSQYLLSMFPGISYSSY